ncbi:MAG: ComF family protein [Sedimentisphaerales bacterium]|nr:ComF family protein [Sedimentisphaerales bacterium]
MKWFALPDSRLLLRRAESLRRLGRQAARAAMGLLFPAVCSVCRREHDGETAALCPDCWQELRQAVPGAYCPVCGHNSGPYALIDGRCHRCQNHRPAVGRVARVGEYQGVLRELILSYKFKRQSLLDDLLGGLLAAAILGDDQIRRADVLVPIPLHWRRRWQRGYDQAELLAQAAGRHLRRQGQTVQVNRDLLRIRHTPPQTSLARSHRLWNLRGAFAVRPDAGLAEKHICLIDDVSTTGTTLRVAAGALRRSGAGRICAAVLAVAANE